MLSICIPTYNYNVTRLVTDLSEQCINLKINYEIIIIEDGSDDVNFQENKRSLNGIKNLYHINLLSNVGRSAVRNMLADVAKYDKLLFLDCDSRISHSSYIENYIKNAHHDIVCGGTLYIPLQNEKNKTLRYKYGIKREMIKAEVRTKNPNQAFSTFNFMISKRIFKSIRFREFLKNYGHEDSLFGYELMENKYTICHINNPVVHEGIEDNSIFLKKTEQGIMNLVLIEGNRQIDKKFTDEIKLIKTYKNLKKYKVLFLFEWTYDILRKPIVNHLLNSDDPSVRIFDFYKLGYYIKNLNK